MACTTESSLRRRRREWHIGYRIIRHRGVSRGSGVSRDSGEPRMSGPPDMGWMDAIPDAATMVVFRQRRDAADLVPRRVPSARDNSQRIISPTGCGQNTVGGIRELSAVTRPEQEGYDMSEVRELDNMVTPPTLDRLRRSKADAAVRDARDGDRDGRAWALRRAEWRHLQAMEEMAQDFEDPNFLDGEDDPPGGLAWAMVTRLRIQHGEVRGVDEMRTILFHEPLRRHSPEYTAAYVQAAAAVYREVVEQI